jgi:hypothetical protein
MAAGLHDGVLHRPLGHDLTLVFLTVLPFMFAATVLIKFLHQEGRQTWLCPQQPLPEDHRLNAARRRCSADAERCVSAIP